ncbi:hypothetical protein CDO51_02220 [Natranaerobius trueperi]|uniref:AtpZ/AtpI family protein n=1 Tax=Natranaerobius trueperi TaxID=759412 RepID=A0A226C2F6_9FIRM|nr:hypothetical protein CDO51_02220 [Natranaerobius trueperi]
MVLAQVGLVIITPVVGAFFIGSFMQERFAFPGGLVVVMALIGLLGGLLSAYKMLMKWWRL